MVAPTTATFSPTARPVVMVGGIPLVWLVVLVCICVVIFVCASSYPIILIIRWRAREMRALGLEEDMDDDEPPDRPTPLPAKKKGRGGNIPIFGAGRMSTRGKWVERRDPETGAPYFENTGTGEVSWTDPRPPKMRGSAPSQPPRPNGGSGAMVSQPMPQMGQLAQSFLPPGRGPPPGVQAAPPSRGTMGAGRPQAPPQMQQAAPASDPKFEKYARMQKAGLPEGAVRNAMTRDAISEAEQNKFLGGG